jgi:hypothetical protein
LIWLGFAWKSGQLAEIMYRQSALLDWYSMCNEVESTKPPSMPNELLTMNLTLPWEMPVIMLVEKQISCQQDDKLKKSRNGYAQKRNE